MADPAAASFTRSGEVVLEARSIAKSFGGTQALKGVSVAFRTSEVQAIVGENGAGKSTLVKILCGFYPSGSYSGEMILDGRPIHIDGIHGAEASGIFLVPQDLQIVPELSIAENLFLNREPVRFGVIKPHVLLPEAAAWLREFGLDADPAKRIGDLMPAQQQLVVIARAMMHGVRLLALDEPTAALTDAETQVLFDHLNTLRSKGIAIAYISHRLDEIARIADTVTVLRDGLVVDRLDRREERAMAQRIVRAMVGRDVDLNRRNKSQPGKVRLSLRNLTVVAANSGARRKQLDGLDLDVRSGEVVGVFGSVGCGADEVVHGLLGVARLASTSEIRVDDRPVHIASPADALRAGIGYLPGHRQRDGTFPLLSIAHNIGVLTLGRMTRAGVISPADEIRLAHDFYSRFQIKASSLDALISTLSGGNQQKTLLARILSRDPAILILHDPTQGVDIATRQEVYAVIDQLAQAGKTILLVTSDVEEVLVASDRILVLRQGRQAGLWDRDEANQHQIIAAATGGE